MIAIFQPNEVPVDAKGDNDMNLKWGPLGITTALLVPYQHDVDGWVYRAMLAGLSVIYSPGAALSKNMAPGKLTAIASNACPDEPDINNAAVAALSAETVQLAATFPGVPQYQGVSGGCVLGLQSTPFTDDQYRQVLKGKKYVASDFYPVTAWGRPDFIGKWYDLAQRLVTLVDPGTELIAILEMSGQNFPNVPGSAAGASPAQIQAQAALALVAGFKHLGWFALRPPTGGFSFDSSTDAQKAAVKAANALYAQYADFIARGVRVATVNGAHYRGDWTLSGQTLTITVDLSAATPAVSASVGAAQASAGSGLAPLPVTISAPGYTAQTVTLQPK